VPTEDTFNGAFKENGAQFIFLKRWNNRCSFKKLLYQSKVGLERLVRNRARHYRNEENRPDQAPKKLAQGRNPLTGFDKSL
jgi:hypothetical protein